MQRCSNWDRQPKSRVGVDMWDTTSQCPGRDPDTRITNPIQQAQNTGSLSQLPITNRKLKDWFMEISRLTRSRSPWCPPSTGVNVVPGGCSPASRCRCAGPGSRALCSRPGKPPRRHSCGGGAEVPNRRLPLVFAPDFPSCCENFSGRYFDVSHFPWKS